MAKASSEIAASPASLSMLPSALMQEIDQSVTQLIRNVKAAKGEQLGAHSYSYTITGSSKSGKGSATSHYPFSLVVAKSKVLRTVCAPSTHR